MKWWWWLGISLVMLGVAMMVGAPDGRARLIVCDVGQGEAILFSQDRFQMLVDTGPPTNKVLGCLEKYLPWGDKTIETVVISHGDADHDGGLNGVMNYYKIDNLYSAVRLEGINEQINYTDNISKGGIIKYGLMQYEILSPESIENDSNRDSVVGVISYKDKKILVMGDVPAEVEQRLVWRQEIIGKINYLVVSHHGSGEATSQELVDRVKPEEAIISVGKNNQFGHPTKQVLDRLREKGIRIRRTDEEGDIVLGL